MSDFNIHCSTLGAAMGLFAGSGISAGAGAAIGAGLGAVVGGPFFFITMFFGGAIGAGIGWAASRKFENLS